MHQNYVAIVLPEALNQLVLPHKEWMRDRYGCLVGLRSPAHITLLPPFWMDPALEDSFRLEVEAFAATQKTFPIRTRGFSAFPLRTLFIDVVVDDALLQLKSACDQWFTPLKQYGVKIDSRPFHPHITIATRDLPKGAFAEAW
ncbi:MAG: 2'-5' RNA ligase family protein, partial [Chitinophagaceae bacterium]